MYQNVKLANFRKSKFEVFEDDTATQVEGALDKEAGRHHTHREVDVLRSLTAYMNQQRVDAQTGKSQR